jgi:hypothetical protein
MLQAEALFRWTLRLFGGGLFVVLAMAILEASFGKEPAGVAANPDRVAVRDRDDCNPRGGAERVRGDGDRDCVCGVGESPAD